MRMKKFHQKHVQGVRIAYAPHHNPIRINQDGHRHYQDCTFSVCFYHRKDTDILLSYTFPFDPHGETRNDSNVIDALSYLRRRMSYTQQALRSSDDLETQIANWIQTGIRPRVRNSREGHFKRAFAAHRATYLTLREFMGDEIMQEFLAVTPEGAENE